MSIGNKQCKQTLSAKAKSVLSECLLYAKDAVG